MHTCPGGQCQGVQVSDEAISVLNKGLLRGDTAPLAMTQSGIKRGFLPPRGVDYTG
ncbi:MAG TPA: hypothetical protein VI753_07045 [Anaerolineales bacterium]|nr:hypothetical protein [Anaerolineales bacterium]